MAETIKLAVYSSSEGADWGWHDIHAYLSEVDILYRASITSIDHLRFDEEKLSAADLVIFNVMYIPLEQNGSTFENISVCLEKMRETKNLREMPVAIVYESGHPHADQISSLTAHSYKINSNLLLGRKAGEQFADFIGKMCEDILNKRIGRKFPGRQIFLSHSWKDKKFVRKLAKDLTKNGAVVWIDEAEIKLGDSLIYRISNAIDQVDYFAVLISHNSVNSTWVQKELEMAMNKEFERKDTVVLPLILDDCPIPSFIKGKLYADMSTPDNYKNGLRLLLNRMHLT